VKGVIIGGTITVTNSAGANVPLVSGTTTGADGSYNLVFTEAAIAAGISAPLIVTINGTGAMTVCDIDNAGTTNDCSLGDGTFAAFGAIYPLPAGFTMRGLVATIPSATTNQSPVVTVNITPASDLSATLALAAAAGSALTVSDVTSASAEVLGLIQTITGVPLSGLTLNEIPVPNITDPARAAAASDASNAIAAFAAAIVANQGAGETVADVIARVNASLTKNAKGNLTATGTVLASLTGSVRRALQTIAAEVALGGGNNAGIVAADNNAQAIEAIYMALGAADVEVSPIPDPTSTDALDLTKAFVNKFNSVISASLATTGAGGVGEIGQGATELFSAELDAAARLNEGSASAAATALVTAIDEQVAAFQADGTVDYSNMNTENPASFKITKTGGVFTLADISSSYTDTAGTNVLITATSGSSSGEDVFELVDVTMVTTTPAATEGGDPVTIQTFTAGTLKGEVVDGDTVTTFDGTLNGTSDTTSFGLNIVFTDPAGMLTGDLYVATLSFASADVTDLSVVLAGTISPITSQTNQGIPDLSIDSVSITAGSNTIASTITQTESGQTVVFSDGPAMMTLSLANGNVVNNGGTIATLTVTGTQTPTGTIDANGTVTYSDGSFQSLPAGIF